MPANKQKGGKWLNIINRKFSLIFLKINIKGNLDKQIENIFLNHQAYVPLIFQKKCLK